MAPVITLLSDLGMRDAVIANVKALIARNLISAQVIDISQKVGRNDLQQTAYLLLSAFPHFPQGTVHLIIVDVLGSNNSKLLLHERQGQYIIAPDNGILTIALGTDIVDVRLCAAFEEHISFAQWLDAAINAAKKILAGEITFFAPFDDIQKRAKQSIIPTLNGIDCAISYIDRYGNVILDITQTQFEEAVGNKLFRIRTMRKDVTTISKLYSDVAEGEPLCRFNHAGYLEIAVNRASAADLLGLGANNSGNLHYQTVKIQFREKDI